MNKLEESLGEEWYSILKDEFDKLYMSKLRDFLSEQKKTNIIYPPSNEVFNTYKLTPYSNVRVCIIGQDPYINQFEAHGLAFSTFNGSYTPTLKKIEESIRKQIKTENYIWSNNLTRWSEQGIMLLNSILTVNAGQSDSHKNKGWEIFILRTIQELDKRGVIFALWGRNAQVFRPHIINSVVLECEHPVAASYKKREWNNNDCFNKINELLDKKIIW